MCSPISRHLCSKTSVPFRMRYSATIDSKLSSLTDIVLAIVPKGRILCRTYTENVWANDTDNQRIAGRNNPNGIWPVFGRKKLATIGKQYPFASETIHCRYFMSVT